MTKTRTEPAPEIAAPTAMSGAGSTGLGAGSAAPEATPAPRGPHRLRQLDRRGRAVALAFAVALVLAPLLAFVRYAPDWVPSQDPAMMAMRALDVGTADTPLLGQPSLAHRYVEGPMVRHLGPAHFYLLAPFVRVFGAPVGMLLVSLLITGGCLLLAAWASYRQLGPAGGILAAVVLGAITFTTGASSLANPVSSHIAGYPFLLSMVLLWCLWNRDWRLLPLTVVVVSFTAQQHLSVLPVLGLVTAAVGVAAIWSAWRRGPWRAPDWRHTARRWLGGSVVLAVVLWSPVLVQQAIGNNPNLSALLRFTRADERPTLGLGTSVRQVVNVLGVPPMLGRTDLTGRWLFREPSALTWLSAAAVVSLVVAAGLRSRRTKPAPAHAAAMTVLLAVGGLLGGASVPEGAEQFRIVFYHWALALLFFTLLGLGSMAGPALARRLAVLRQPSMRRSLVAGAFLVIVVPSLVNPTLDRWSNSLNAAYSPIDRATLDELTDEVMEQRSRLDGTVVVTAAEEAWSTGIYQALALELEQRGVPAKHTHLDGAFVSHGRQANRSEVDTGLVVTLDTELVNDGAAADELTRRFGPPVADVEIAADFDRNGYEALAAEKHEFWTTPFMRPRRLRVFLLDRQELLAWASRDELR